ncbi:TrbG/VirB9 family P-type conjugative transfer protein [uncultured Erythrobacter sp.]|uniref:TrbG/VirB9 family P-type conjugative transfer protein n=1 Tax=uncultured Erythrobacter sp. TaxID=263913 RepID=UPI002626FE7C|nr:TrbG/VirB9 family P-type conjugative transfer protein [uncultured Erythrobacter sp.]
MKSSLAILLLAFSVSAASAQTFPTPNPDNPRIQSAPWSEGQPVIVTALPESTLTVILEPSEQVTRATLSGNRAWDISVPTERNSIQITPQAGALAANLTVQTDARTYEFVLEVDEGLMGAYLVKLQYEPAMPLEEWIGEGPIDNLTWGYRLRGDKEVRPQSIRDNGSKTVITYAPDQALPAVFAVGPTGDEEVVDGYMRGDVFVIDRVHKELVFRINRDKATAKRNQREDGEE